MRMNMTPQGLGLGWVGVEVGWKGGREDCRARALVGWLEWGVSGPPAAYPALQRALPPLLCLCCARCGALAHPAAAVWWQRRQGDEANRVRDENDRYVEAERQIEGEMARRRIRA